MFINEKLMGFSLAEGHAIMLKLLAWPPRPSLVTYWNCMYRERESHCSPESHSVATTEILFAVSRVMMRLLLPNTTMSDPALSQPVAMVALVSI